MFVISLNYYSLIFVLPIFLIGCVLLWLGQSSVKIKIIVTIAPLILWYPSFLGFMYLNSFLGLKFAQEIEFRIPSDFRGQVTIIFPVACGQPVRKENGREIIDVPKNGLVYYQGFIESGYMNWTYKLQDSVKTSMIYKFKTWNMSDEELNDIKPNTLGVFGGGGWSASSMSEKPQIDYNVRLFVVDKWKGKSFDHYVENQDSIAIIYEKGIRKCNK